MTREWFVYATPVTGYFPTEAEVDPYTETANKVVDGPFDDAISAAQFVERERPSEQWCKVSIYSKLKAQTRKREAK